MYGRPAAGGIPRMKRNTHKPLSRKTAEPGAQEVEVKLRVADRSALRRRLFHLRAKPQGSRVYEMNTLYDTPENVLRRSGRMLRVRVERPADRAGKAKAKAKKAAQRNASPRPALLTYKGSVQPGTRGGASGRRRGGPSYKVREERESRVIDGDAMATILDGIGFHPSFRYEKYRTTFRLPGLPGLKVELDETPIGDFLELEGARDAIDRAAKLLGFGPADYIARSYGALYLEYASTRGREEQGEALPARDMLFSTARSTPK